jgi:hypothetical protein
MAIQQPPITEDSSLNFTLLELINLINKLESDNVALIKDIKAATNFADLQAKVNAR